MCSGCEQRCFRTTTRSREFDGACVRSPNHPAKSSFLPHAMRLPETLLNWDEDGLGEREDAEEWDAMFAEDSEEEEDD